MANWEEIRNEWETSKITLAALAEKHNVKLGTLKSRKSREKWSRDATNQKDATISKKVATIQPVIQNEDLSDNEIRFCLEYIKYFNATKAYQKAFGCSYNSAKSHGYKLLLNVAVKNEIERLKAEQQQSLFLEAKDILQKYIDIAFADITDFVIFGSREIVQKDSYSGEPLTNEDGEPIMDYVSHVDLVNSDEVDGTIITEVKQGREGISVKLADKMKALEMLSKYFDLLSENDKKQYEIERLKAETQKAQSDAERIAKESGSETEEIIIVDAWGDEDD